MDHRTPPAHFEAVAAGKRLFAVVQGDLQVGDVLVLREWHSETEEYTGRYLVTEVTYVTPQGFTGLREGFVIVGLGSHNGAWGIEHSGE